MTALMSSSDSNETKEKQSLVEEGQGGLPNTAVWVEGFYLTMQVSAFGRGMQQFVIDGLRHAFVTVKAAVFKTDFQYAVFVSNGG